MDEEMKKIKYRQLLNKLYTIRNKYQELDNVFDDLNATVKENLLIDDKNIKEDDFDDAKNSIISLKDELEGDIIPIVRSRTWEEDI